MKFWDFLNENLFEVGMILLVVISIGLSVYQDHNKTQQMKLKMDYCLANPTTDFCKDLK